MKYLLFGAYSILIVGLFGYLAIIVMHLKGFSQYSRYIKPVTKIYLIVILVIAIFGGYKILMGDTIKKQEFNSISTQY